jgi:xylan 1,4-beta-xylosidase
VKTYCNPLPLPSYQRGRNSLDKSKTDLWYRFPQCDFREMADPTVLFFEGRWYLFPSAGMLWHSDDLVDWTYQPIEPFDFGYAPTVVQHADGYLYLTACSDQMFRAKHPLGPWESVGPVLDHTGKRFCWSDPMLFSDDDGQIYCYHGLGKDGIYVVRLDPRQPWRWAEDRRHCFPFRPEHTWECRGEYNQDPTVSYIEGAWMTKHSSRYYLQYSGPGTEWTNYALGCYVAESPLGPWRYQKRNPILRAPRGQGVVNGAGHHSVVRGPGNTLWCFYTTSVRIEHGFERRIGMDPVGFDDNGEMFVAGPTQTPQLAPGLHERPENGNDAGLLPLSVNQPIRASSTAPGRDAVYANDDQIRTWWQADGPAPQWIRVDLSHSYDVSAIRLLFADRGLNYDAGVTPGPYRYLIEGSLDGESWSVLFDHSHNTVDRHIAYHTWPPQSARHIRLTILEAPRGMQIGLWELTVFGRAS